MTVSPAFATSLVRAMAFCVYSRAKTEKQWVSPVNTSTRVDGTHRHPPA